MKKCFAFCFLLAALFLLLLAACAINPSPATSANLSETTSDGSGEGQPATSPAESGGNSAAESSAVASAEQSDETSSGMPIDTSGFFQPPCDCYASIPALLRDPDPQLVPPGTPPAVVRVPELNDPDVGKTCTLDLVPSCSLAMLHFTYERSETTGKERLIVVETHNIAYSLHCATLSVYETELGGGKELYEAIAAGSLRAKLLARTYITEQESTSVGITDQEPGTFGYFAADEFIGSAEEAAGDRLFGTLRFSESLETPLLAYHTLPDGRCLALVRGSSDVDGGKTKQLSHSWQKIYERFDERCGLLSLTSVD